MKSELKKQKEYFEKYKEKSILTNFPIDKKVQPTNPDKNSIKVVPSEICLQSKT